jgi:hypothetical protein
MQKATWVMLEVKESEFDMGIFNSARSTWMEGELLEM